MDELISVIIPVYNRIEAFRQALDSVLKQTYKNVEIIVVDDGSEPPVQSSEFRVQGNNIDIHLFRQENKGAPVARNKGFELSHGEYVIFWDADVIAKPDMLQKMVEVLEKNNEASFIYCDFRLLPISKKMKAQKFNLDVLKKNNYIHTTSLIRRKDVIKWDESLKRFQDWDLWLTMGRQGKKGIWIEEYLFSIVDGGTISSWLPGFAYKKPWCYLPWIKSRVKIYKNAKKIILEKHSLPIG